MLHISRDDIAKLVSYEEVVDAVEEGMRYEAEGKATSAARINLPLGPTWTNGFSLIPGRNAMSIWMAGSDDRGGTFRSLSGGGGIALYIDAQGDPAAIIDFPLLQAYRTGAAAAVATKHLARPDSECYGMLGSGRFAKATLIAHARIMNVKEVRVYSPNKEHRERFAKDMESELNLSVRPVDSAPEAVTGADIVLVCTSMNGELDSWVIDGEWLKSGVHVTSNGGASELNTNVYAKASRVVVDDITEMQGQIWDIRRAVAQGVITWDKVVLLPDLVVGKQPGREKESDITLARNRGSGVQDLFPTALVYRKAIEQGVGRDLGPLLVPR